MVDSATGGRTTDANGLPLMLADSHTASNTFGLGGGQFSNAPKTKFLFYVKFFRPDSQGGSAWERGIGLVVKNVDRPRISFKTETLNQYNRKRVVQTSHEFDALQLKFHDTINESVLQMFSEYYRYYYGDSVVSGAGTSVYDVVTGEPYELGKWGFLPPLEAQNYAYFFSHISVYQLYNGVYTQFDLINPKISQYNPDDFDYSSGAITNEIQISIDFESIVYHDSAPLTAELASEFGIDRAQFWDIQDRYPSSANPGLASNPNSIKGSLGDVVGNVLTQNLASLVTGQGTQSIGGIVSSIAGAYDANRSLAVGQTGLKSLKDLVNGNTQGAKQGAQGLLKGVLFGSPGKFF